MSLIPWESLAGGDQNAYGLHAIAVINTNKLYHLMHGQVLYRCEATLIMSWTHQGQFSPY